MLYERTVIHVLVVCRCLTFTSFYLIFVFFGLSLAGVRHRLYFAEPLRVEFYRLLTNRMVLMLQPNRTVVVLLIVTLADPHFDIVVCYV